MIRFLFPCLLILTNTSFSTTFYYAFEGSVWDAYYEQGAQYSSLRELVGRKVQYIFLADFSRVGYYVSNDGTVTVGVDDEWEDSFYTEELTNSSLIPDVGPGYDGFVEGHLGISIPRPKSTTFRSRKNSHTEWAHVDGWIPSDGMTDRRFTFSERSVLANGLTYVLIAEGNLTSISEVNPLIPEPSSIPLFSAGLSILGMLGLCWGRPSQLIKKTKASDI